MICFTNAEWVTSAVADNTCLICYGDDHTQVKDFLSSNLDSLARWIAISKLQVNVEKSHVM